MINNTLTALCAALLCASVAAPKSAYSGEPEPADDSQVELSAAPEPAEKEKPDRLICKREKPIGSKRIRKVCHTRKQLDEESRRTRDAMSRRGSTAGCVECGGPDGG